jgi:hypothetical protein
MRIAAGVLIIIVAILDLLSGFGYAFVGGATAGLGTAASQIAQKDPAVKEAQTAATAARATGGALALFGFFLLAMAGLTIACGVVLFMGKAATFALVIGVLQILAELIGLFLTMGAAIVWQIPGIVAGILVIIAALSYRGKPAAAAPM